MCITNSNNKVKTKIDKIPITTNLNNNLLKTCFIFCNMEDILSLSLVCKKFYIITKELDFIFKKRCEISFCSNYNNL
jgi:hypothetical protein